MQNKFRVEGVSEVDKGKKGGMDEEIKDREIKLNMIQRFRVSEAVGLVPLVSNLFPIEMKALIPACQTPNMFLSHEWVREGAREIQEAN